MIFFSNRFFVVCSIRTLRMTFVLLALNGATVLGAEPYTTEAEALLGQHGYSDSHNEAAPSHYDHASDKVTVYLKGGTLNWPVELSNSGTYFFWMRARSGHEENHFAGHETYRLQMDRRTIRLAAQRNTLDYHAGGENFVWFRSEPMNFDPGKVTFHISSSWHWAHVDTMVLTNNAGYQPPQGNVAGVKQNVSTIVVWNVDPYIAFNPLLTPPTDAPAPTITLTSPRNATAYGAFAASNAKNSPTPAHLLIRQPTMTSQTGNVLANDWVTVHRLAMTGLPTGQLVPDALPQINRLGYVEIGPANAVCFWVMFNIPPEAEPGTYTGELVVENQASLKTITIPIELKIVPVTLAKKTELAVFNWWGHSNASQASWDDQIKHGINTFQFTVYQHLHYQFDINGNLIGEIDFRSLDKIISAYKRTGGYILPQWYLHAEAFATLQCRAPGSSPGPAFVFMSEPWKKAFTTLLIQTTDYLESQGIARDRIVHYTYDEYLGEKFIQVGKLIRSLDPKYQIFSDLSANMQTYQKAAPYVDVWCPQFESLETMAADGRLAFMRSTNKPIWFYDASETQRGHSPYLKYRVKFWRAWRFKLDGCTYWKHQGDRVGTMYYPAVSGDQPITSRRYEAWYSGVQDYKLLKLLEKVAKSDSPRSAAAAKLLNEAVNKVTTQVDQPTFAEKYRQLILAFLSENKTQ